MADRAAVQNAADPAQVRRAGRKDRDDAEQRRVRLHAVMLTPLGRAAMWDLLELAGVFRSIYHASALIHYNAGRQDFGHELMAKLLEVDEDLYIVMEQEARQRKRRDQAALEAAHTPPATEAHHAGV